MNDPMPFPQHRTSPGGRLVAVVSSTSDAELVLAARAGDRRAFSTLFERWFDRSYDVAWRIVRNRDTAAEVAQDTFLAAWTKLGTLRDPEAFGGWVLRSARNKALNRLEREGRSMAFDTDDTVGMVDRQRSAVDVADDIVRQEQHDLVWAAAAALGQRDASILDLHLRHDLDPAQIAETLDISPNAAHQTLFRLRKRLEGAIRSYVLWSDGHPTCPDLAALLDDAAIESFGPTAVRIISGHVADCDACDERHAAILAPASMFAAVPLVVVGPGVRRAAAAELSAQGVPVHPDLMSSTVGSAGTSTTATTRSRTGSGGGAGGSGGASSAKLAVVGCVVAAMVLVLAAVVGAGLLGGDEPAEVEVIAAPATTESPRVLGSTVVPSTTTTADLAEPDDTDTAPPDTEPPLTTEPPTTQPPPTEPPTTTTAVPESTTTTTTTIPPPPVIVAFVLIDDGDLGPCTPTTGSLYTLSWLVEGADFVSIAGSNVDPGPHPPEGFAETCVSAGRDGVWTLTATGPGGTVTRTVTT
jgi:RNA polymerase sigma factor (sigma-70 family)